MNYVYMLIFKGTGNPARADIFGGIFDTEMTARSAIPKDRITDGVRSIELGERRIPYIPAVYRVRFNVIPSLAVLDTQGEFGGNMEKVWEL